MFASAEDHAEWIAELANQYDELHNEVSRLARSCLEIVSRVHPIYLLHRCYWHSAVSLNEHSGRESEVEVEHIADYQMVGYVRMLVCAAGGDETSPVITDEDFATLASNVRALFELLQPDKYYRARTAMKVRKYGDAYNEGLDHFTVYLEFLWATVEGGRHGYFVERHLTETLADHNDMIEACFGLSVASLVEGVVKLQWSLIAGLKDALDILREAQAQLPPPSEVPGDFDLKKYLDTLGAGEPGTRLHWAIQAFFGFALFDVKEITNWPQSLISALTVDVATDSAFVSHDDKRAWPDQPARSRELPFVGFGGLAYAFSQTALHDGLYRALEREVVGASEVKRRQWNARQKKCSERLAVSMIAQMLSSYSLLEPVYYDDEQGKRVESDGLLLIDDHLIVIEVKGGALSIKQPTAHSSAYIEDLRELVGEAAAQARRFVRTYRAQPRMRLFRGEQDSVGYTTLCGGLHIVPVCVTLDQLTDFTPQIARFDVLDIEADKQAPVWAISIDDLRVVADLIHNPIQLVHFLRNRFIADNTDWLDVTDELDHLGMYFAHGAYVKYLDSQRPGNTVVTPTKCRDQFDDYYHALHRGDVPPPPPGPRLPYLLEEVLSVLAAAAKPGFIEVGCQLLNVPDGAALQERLIQSAATQREAGSPIPVVGRKTFPMVVYTQTPEGPHISLDEARTMACAAMQLERVSTWGVLVVHFDEVGRVQEVHHERVSSITAAAIGEPIIRPARHALYKQRSGGRRQR